MSDQLIVEPSGLEKKDKAQLQAIVAALGGEANPRQTKAELISEITKLSESELDVTKDDATEDHTAEEADEDAAPEIEESNKKTSNSNAGRDDSANNRRSKKGRGVEREEAGNDPVSKELTSMSGFLDLRDEGYGFLRVDGFLPSKEDVYVSVKQVRQYGLRKGDHLDGKTMPAHRNEKNPCFSQIDTVNGSLSENSLGRPFFDEMVPVFPSEQIVLEQDGESKFANRFIDLFAPIAKGQRSFLVGPPRSGRTTIIKDVLRAVESNYSDINVLILSVDARPEEVSDLANTLNEGEIVASAFDRPAEEHTATAELTVERAKRLAETGEDVFIIVDSLTQLAKAYITSYIQNSRSATTAPELPALQPIKKLLGAAVNLEGSGSITILSVVTASEFGGPYLDGMIYDELRNHTNSEINLDGISTEGPSFDVLSSQTLRSDLILDNDESIEKIRSVVRSQNLDGETPESGSEKLLSSLRDSSNNKEFLSKALD